MFEHCKDITNKKFGKLTPVKPIDKTKTGNGGNIRWLCKCDCGNTHIVRQGDLTAKHVQSCGCLNKYRFQEYKKYSKRLIGIYHNIKNRCYNTNNPSYKNYGGRGIKMCKSWEKDIFKFLKWALNQGYMDNLTIERINVNGNYSAKNCKWIPRKEQSKNRRNNYLITYKNKTKCLSEWAKEIKQERKLIYYYLQKGLSFGEFLELKNINLD